MIFLYLLIFCVIGYLLGSIVFGQFIAWSHAKDITKIGSTNPGATNITREFGYGMGFLTSVLDAIKGMGAVYICWAIYSVSIFKINSDHNLFCLIFLAGTFAVIGHCFPVTYISCLIFHKFNFEKANKYKGGKGVSTTGGILFTVSPYLGIIAFLIWISIVLITRYVSLGSLFCMTTASFFVLIPPVGYFYLFDSNWLYPEPIFMSFDYAYANEPWLIIGTFILLIVNSVILTIKHHPNIMKLIYHKENKLF